MLLLQHCVPSLAMTSPLHAVFAVAASPLRAQSAVSLAGPGRAAVSLNSLSHLAGLYDVFLLDQFGVIHDGSVAYDGATQAVAHAQERGTKICIISNSSRRKSDTIARLRGMGFGPFDGDEAEGGVPPLSVVTSGDLVWEGLRKAADGVMGDIGHELFEDLAARKCLVFGNGEDDLEYVTSCG